MMPSPSNNPLKLLLLVPLLVLARPSHPIPRANSDDATEDRRLITPNQVTPYPIWWPYPNVPPKHHDPTDPKNEETRWGQPVEPPQPNRTRGSKEDLNENPAKLPDCGRDWSNEKDTNRNRNLTRPTSLARFNDGGTRITNDGPASTTPVGLMQDPWAPNLNSPVTFNDGPINTATPTSSMPATYTWSEFPANGAVPTDATPQPNPRDFNCSDPHNWAKPNNPTAVAKPDCPDFPFMDENEGTPRSCFISTSVVPDHLNPNHLGARDAVPANTACSEVQVLDGDAHSELIRTTPDDGHNTLAGTPDLISADIAERLAVFIGNQDPGEDTSDSPFQHPLDTRSKIQHAQASGDLHSRVDNSVVATGNDILREPCAPIPGQIQHGHVAVNNDEIIPNLYNSDMDEIKSGGIITERNRWREGGPAALEEKVYSEQIPDGQLLDVGATCILDSIPHPSCQRRDGPPIHEVCKFYSFDQRQRLNSPCQKNPVEIDREPSRHFAQLPHGQIRPVPVTPTFYSVSHPATQLPDQQVQTRHKRNSELPNRVIQHYETEDKSTITVTFDNVPSGVIFPLAAYLEELPPAAPTSRRKMQSMIDDTIQALGDPLLCPRLPSCLIPVPEFFSSPFQPLATYPGDAGPSPTLVVHNVLKRSIAGPSAESPPSRIRNDFPKPIASAPTPSSHHARSADNELYQDLSTEPQRGSGRVQLVCLLWVFVFVLLGILEFL